MLSAWFSAIADDGSLIKEEGILTQEESRWLADNRDRLVLAVESAYAPFVFLNDQGQTDGLAQDYIKLIEAKIGATFQQKQFSSLSEIFDKIRAGEVHIVNAVTPTPGRMQFLKFTNPYISIPNVIVVRKDFVDSLSEQTLSGLKVSLVKSYAVTETLPTKTWDFGRT
ncbi:MAG: transporter substrate-binding domain-containing protein [Methylobacter sp.]